MLSSEISPELLQQLQQRAAQANTTVENLLTQWLSSEAANIHPVIIEQLSDAVITTDTALRITSWNSAAEALYGWTAAEAKGQALDELVKTQWSTETREQAQAALRQTGRWQGELTQYARSGQELVVLASVNWLRDASGSIVGGVTINRDITARKRTEEMLRQSAAHSKTFFESQTAFVCRINLEGYFTYANQRFLERHGLNEVELLNMQPLDTVVPEDHQKVRDTVEECLKTPNRPIQVIIRKPGKSGDIYTSLWEFTALTDEAGQPNEILCIGFDITTQVNTQTALRQSEDRYQRIVETAQEGIWVLDADDKITYANQHIGEMLGYTQAEMVGQHFFDFMTPEQHPQAQYYLERRRRGIAEHYEFCFQHKDGKEVWATVSSNPMLSDLGEYQGTMKMLTDITARKEAEALRQEQERLRAVLQREQEWNVLIHRAIAALDHDIRTPLSVIATSKNILENYPHQLDAKNRQERLATIGRQLDYVMKLIHDLTEMLKGNLSERKFNPRKIDLGVLCQIIVKEMQTTIGVSHRFEFINRALSAQMIVDEVLISRILLNLLSNAVKYSPQKSLIRLELDTLPSNRIELRVIDQGIGIHPEDQAKIFDVFYRAADVGDVEGSGLGLNIVQDCVRRHQGVIRLESEWGKGTTFIIELPQQYA